MHKLIRFLSMMGVASFALVSCEIIETRLPPDEAKTTIDYETEANELFDEDASSARLAATEKGKVTIGYMNNETELFRPSSYTISLWKSNARVIGTLQQIAASVTGKKPTTTAKKNNLRSYTRKTLPVGWYIANVVDSDTWSQFQVTAGSDGLLCFNENSASNPLFNGYYPIYGKVKVSLWYGKVQVADAHVILSKDIAPPGEVSDFKDLTTWLYAEDGTGAKKGMFWYMPSGTYSIVHWANRPDGSGSYPNKAVGLVSIAPGKIYPHVKLSYN